MNDDEYGALLLRPLAGEPAGPPGLDVAKAMRDGLRMRRRRWWTAGTTLIAAITATLLTGGLLLSPAQQDDKPKPPDLPPDPAVPASCTADLLPMGGNKAVMVTAGDPAGRWQAGITDPNSYWPKDRKLLVWHDGKLVTEADTPAAGKGVQLSDFNTAGLGVGRFDTLHDIPYLYRNGKLTRLKGGAANAIAINDAGQIAGEAGPFDKEKPARWPSPDAEPELLPMPAGKAKSGRVMDIAPDGTVVGRVGFDAYLWPPDGTVRKLPLPPAPQPGPTDAMRPGERSGSSIDPIGFSFGWLYAEISFRELRNAELYRYDLGSGTWQRLGPAHGEAQLATAGSVSAWAQDEPRVWVGPRQLELPQYLPSLKADLDVFLVKAVSDDAHVIAGTALSGPADLTLPYQPIRWRCR